MREVVDRAASTPLLDRTISPRTLHDPPKGGLRKERSDIVERPSKRVSRTVVGVIVKVRLLLMQRCSALWLFVRFHSRFFVLAVVDFFYPGQVFVVVILLLIVECLVLVGCGIRFPRAWWVSLQAACWF